MSVKKQLLFFEQEKCTVDDTTLKRIEENDFQKELELPEYVTQVNSQYVQQKIQKKSPGLKAYTPQVATNNSNVQNKRESNLAQNEMAGKQDGTGDDVLQQKKKLEPILLPQKIVESSKVKLLTQNFFISTIDHLYTYF